MIMSNTHDCRTCRCFEVLADLRILEQQQLESQRKLEMARFQKQQKLEQKVALETDLGKLKFANGKLREQKKQNGEALSAANRELGKRRLASNQIGDRIQKFNTSFEKARLSRRRTAMAQRMIESLLIEIQKTESDVSLLRIEADRKLSRNQKEIQEVIQQEDSLKKSIQEKAEIAKKLSDASAKLIDKNQVLSQELAKTQSAEQMAKAATDKIEAEIERENIRHEREAATLKSKIEIQSRRKDDISRQADSTERALKEKTNQAHDAWNRLIELQAQEGHDVALPHTDPQASPPVFDLERLRESIEKGDAELSDFKSKHQQLEESVGKLRSDVAKTEESTAIKVAKAASIIKNARRAQQNEDSRIVNMKEFLQELGDAKNEVAELVAQLKLKDSERDLRTTEDAKLVNDLKNALCNDRDALESAKSSLEEKKDTVENLEESLDHEKSTMQQTLKEVKTNAEKSKNSLVDVTAQLTLLTEVSDLETLDDAVRRVQQQGKTRCKAARDECSRLRESEYKDNHTVKSSRGGQTNPLYFSKTSDYPELQILNFTYDLDRTSADQVEDALKPLVENLEAKLTEAKEARDIRQRQRGGVKRREQTAASKVRQEQDAEEYREFNEQIAKKDAKMKAPEPRDRAVNRRTQNRHQTGYHVPQKEKGEEIAFENNPEDEICRQNSKKLASQSQKPRKSKGADFYNPRSHGSSIEEETPARPQVLLPAFRNATQLDMLAKNQNFSTSPCSQDKRVHWHDEDSKGHGFVDASPKIVSPKPNKDLSDRVEASRERNIGPKVTESKIGDFLWDSSEDLSREVVGHEPDFGKDDPDHCKVGDKPKLKESTETTGENAFESNGQNSGSEWRRSIQAKGVPAETVTGMLMLLGESGSEGVQQAALDHEESSSHTQGYGGSGSTKSRHLASTKSTSRNSKKASKGTEDVGTHGTSKRKRQYGTKALLFSSTAISIGRPHAKSASKGTARTKTDFMKSTGARDEGQIRESMDLGLNKVGVTRKKLEKSSSNQDALDTSGDRSGAFDRVTSKPASKPRSNDATETRQNPKHSTKDPSSGSSKPYRKTYETTSYSKEKPQGKDYIQGESKSLHEKSSNTSIGSGLFSKSSTRLSKGNNTTGCKSSASGKAHDSISTKAREAKLMKKDNLSTLTSGTVPFSKHNLKSSKAVARTKESSNSKNQPEKGGTSLAHSKSSKVSGITKGSISHKKARLPQDCSTVAAGERKIIQRNNHSSATSSRPLPSKSEQRQSKKRSASTRESLPKPKRSRKKKDIVGGACNKTQKFSTRDDQDFAF